MTKLTSVTFAAVAAILAAMASASATAGETTPSGFAAVAQLPVTALSSSEMAETKGTGADTYYIFDGITTDPDGSGVAAIVIRASKVLKFKPAASKP